MNHISEEQLVLFYYGELPESAGIENHLEECEVCRDEFRAVQLVLNTVDSAPVPERSADYGRQVWQRIESRIGHRPRRSVWRWWVWAPAMATLVIGAFLAGRLSYRPASGVGVTPVAVTNPQNQQSNQQIRERILLVAVGDHLERSQMVLAELSNAPAGKGKLDITDERQIAADLLDDNRLYRQTAANTGDKRVASVLDDLENVLMEIAHSPTEVSSQQLDALRQQIQERGLLFKVRVLGTSVREQENKPPAVKDQPGKKL
jgi:polyhydroxyalkanoate synthesis regulator phasin